MPTENIKSQIRKGILDYCILLLLNKRAAYTNDIIQLLQNAKLIVVEGTLYPLLSRLKNNGLLSYEWIESTQGPPRKYYRITDAGKVVLAELDTIWKEIGETIELIKQN
ncbi:MAG: PadR family transcriptional regulator [Bacteroidales bacterium]|nr:PadR family transcriptional regulator [Bacteroidales bacterium]